MNLLVRNVIEREIEREKVQMKPPLVDLKYFLKGNSTMHLKINNFKGRRTFVPRRTFDTGNFFAGLFLKHPFSKTETNCLFFNFVNHEIDQNNNSLNLSLQILKSKLLVCYSF